MNFHLLGRLGLLGKRAVVSLTGWEGSTLEKLYPETIGHIRKGSGLADRWPNPGDRNGTDLMNCTWASSQSVAT